MYYTEDAIKTTSYMADEFEQAVIACEGRGWTVVGGITDNASTEIGCMADVKKGRVVGPAFANLRCCMHTANLLMQDVLMFPKKRRSRGGTRSTFRKWR